MQSIPISKISYLKISVSLKPTRVKVLYAICKILSKEFIDVVSSMIPITRKENYNMYSVYCIVFTSYYLYGIIVYNVYFNIHFLFISRYLWLISLL